MAELDPTTFRLADLIPDLDQAIAAATAARAAGAQLVGAAG